MGQPSGGASLGENVECRITVTNDILPGKIDFASPNISAKQTDEEIVVKIIRSQYTEGNFKPIFKQFRSLYTNFRL